LNGGVAAAHDGNDVARSYRRKSHDAPQRPDASQSNDYRAANAVDPLRMSAPSSPKQGKSAKAKGADTAPAPAHKSSHKRTWQPFQLFRARPRLIIALSVFLVTSGVLVATGMRWPSAILLGFDLGAVVFLVILARLFNRSTPTKMRHQARLQDTGRWGILWSGIVLSSVVMVALSSELHAAKGGGVMSLAVGALSVILSWLFLNIMFAMHYAHGFYGDYGEKHTGLEFPDTPEPDYWDFAYFSIVIGMTFQVSDVQITSRYLRRVALMHSVIAFFFNVFIIAITVNIVAGQG
jgi:uncharacterized membrane protein